MNNEIQNILDNYSKVSTWTKEVFLARLEAIWSDEENDSETREFASEAHRELLLS